MATEFISDQVFVTLGVKTSLTHPYLVNEIQEDSV